MTQINSATGRPSFKPDWKLVDQLILTGLNLSQTCNALNCSPKTLNSICLSNHGQTFLSYSKNLKARLGKTGGAFDFAGTASLLRNYYSGKLARLDHAKTDSLPPVKAWYPRSDSPSTGKRLMDILSARDVDSAMSKLFVIELSIKGVKVDRGYEYPLMCFASPEFFQNNPSYQKIELPPLYEYLETYGYWDTTRLGVSLVKKSFIEFNKAIRPIISERLKKPKQKESW